VPKIRLPFADKANNRSYLNTADYLLLNAYIEHNSKGADIIKRPGFKSKLATSSIVTDGRGFTYSNKHSLYYALIGDALFSIDSSLATVTEIARKTPTAASWGAGVATYTFAAAHGFIAGQSVNVSGISPAGYSGVLTILAVTTVTVPDDSFTVTMATLGAATLTNARVSPILTTTGKAYFEQTKSSTTINTMLLIPKTSTTASQLFMIAASGVVTRVTDADLPVDLIGAPVSIDGYLFVLSAAESEIYNMDLEAPTSINSLGFVAADTYADTAVTLAKHHNQLVCKKEYSTEFFYNANIAAPYSPFAKIPQQTLTLGCASAASVVQTGQSIIWMSRNQNGGLAVHMMTGGQAQKVSTVSIDRILASMESFVFSDKVESCYLSVDGHDFYVLSVDGVVSGTGAVVDYAVVDVAVVDTAGALNSFKRTMVYDITQNEWCEWSSLDETTSTQSSFFATYSVSGPHVTNAQDFSNTLVMEKTTGNIYEMSPAPLGVAYLPTYKDGSRTITVECVFNPVDGGTRNRKRCNSLEILGDTASSSVSVSYSDNDYATWSTARTISLVDRARIPNLGMFRRRAFKLTHAADTPLRLAGIELDVERMES